MSLGRYHGCVLRASDGLASCWGDPPMSSSCCDFGQQTAAGVFSALATGHYHSCGLLLSGEIDCWGRDPSGQSTPPAGLLFSAVTAGGAHSCGLMVNRTGLCWGSNVEKSDVPAGEKSAISVGTEHTCTLNMTGYAECFGLNDEGTSNAPSGTAYSLIFAGEYHTCAVKQADGEGECWGINFNGISTAPTGVALRAISAGSYRTCGLRADNGNALCWGDCRIAYVGSACDVPDGAAASPRRRPSPPAPAPLSLSHHAPPQASRTRRSPCRGTIARPTARCAKQMAD